MTNTSEIQALAKATSTHRPLGWLDLPAKIRRRIFRHLLIKPRGLRFECYPQTPRVPVNVLRTNKLIHKEASAILYGENTFVDCFDGGYYPLKSFPRVSNLVQNIHIEVNMTQGYLDDIFYGLMKNFGDTSIARGTLVITFFLYGIKLPPLKNPMIALSMLNSFRTIEVLFFEQTGHSLSPVFEYVKPILEPDLGDAEYFRADNKGPLGMGDIDGWYPEDYSEDEEEKKMEEAWKANLPHTEFFKMLEESEILLKKKYGKNSKDEDGRLSGDEDGEHAGDEDEEHSEGDEDGRDKPFWDGHYWEGLRFHPRSHQNLDGSQPDSPGAEEFRTTIRPLPQYSSGLSLGGV